MTGITSGQVTTALGFTPYNATNPSNYITTAALSTYATQTYVGTQIANLVASSPAALDTLNELAAALGNDAAFSTTVSTALGNRLRVDINTQGLSATLQGYGRTNLGLGTAATSNTGDFVAYRTFGTAANSATGDFVAYRTFGTAANNNTGDFAAASHTHSIANVTGLQTALDGKQASGSYAAATHSHIISDVTGLQTALDGKQASLGFTPYNSTNPSGYIALTALSGSTGISYNSTTGAISSTITQYTDALARAAHSFVAGSGAYNSTTGVITIPTNNNQITNGAGYITSYTETDTLDSVTGRGSTTLNIVQFGTSITAKGNTSGNGGAAIKLLGWFGGSKNWQIDTAFTSGINELSFSPSTTDGGSTFTTQVIKFTSVGGATFNGSISASNLSGTNTGDQIIPTNNNQLTNGAGYITSSGSTSGSAFYSTFINSRDTRNTNDQPQDFDSYVKFDFKANATNSLSDGGSYNGVMTLRPYGSSTDFSGGGAHQIGFTSSGNLYHRVGTTNAWGSWLKFLDSSNALSLTGGTLSGQLTIDGLNFSGNTDSLYITNKRGSYYPLRILNSQGDYRGVLIEHVDGTGSGGPGPDGSFGFKFEDKRGSNYSGDHKASFIVKRSGAFGVTSIFEVISTSNTSLAVTTGGKVVVNSTSNIATGALSIVSGGSAGVGWGSGLNIGDSANYMGFIQDVGTSRFRNHGNGVFEFLNSGGDTNFAISSLGNLSIRGNALGGGFVNLLSASKKNYYTFTGYPNQNVGGVPKNVCDEVNSAGLSWTDYGYQTSQDGAGLAYIKVDLNAAHLVTHFAVFGYTGGSHKPTGNWNLLGSNDDANWTTVGTANAAQWMADNNGTYPFRPHAIVKCSNPGSYRYYRVQAYGWTNGYLLMHNWGLFTGGAMTDIYNDGVTTGGAVYAGGDVTAYSDISVKENIRPIINSLEKITKSRGVLYDRIDSGAKNNIGFIAQELEINFPELIHTNDDGTKGVKYQNATAILFEAIKEQQTQIESQKSEIDELKDLVQQLINR